MSTIKVNNLQNASASSPAFVLAADGSATANLSSVNGGPLSGMRNRILNGDMRLDQRNAGASVTPSSGQYLTDRWQVLLTQSSKFTAQQNAGSVTPPSQFTNYLGFTSSSAYSVVAGDRFVTRQVIEGFNVADLAWGTASAQSVTLSFWVRSSLTGTFGGALQNDASNRSYPFAYTISAANTWEQKTISIAGDTTGTWLTTNGGGIHVVLGFGVGTTFSGTAGSWSGSNFLSATGATSVVGTSGATFYITGVQLEPGTVATPFERRSYGQELALCQRYFQKTYNQSVVPGTDTANGALLIGDYNGAIRALGQTFLTPLRAGPTLNIWDKAGNVNRYSSYDTTWNNNLGSVSTLSAGESSFLVIPGSAAGVATSIHYTASAEL